MTEQDAQSLGITTPSSDFEEENNDEKNVEPDNFVTGTSLNAYVFKKTKIISSALPK